MVYKDCPLGLKSEQYNKRRTTEFYINGKPQIYCYGIETDGGTREECVTCPNWSLGEQVDIDYQKAKENGYTVQCDDNPIYKIFKGDIICRQ